MREEEQVFPITVENRVERLSLKREFDGYRATLLGISILEKRPKKALSELLCLLDVLGEGVQKVLLTEPVMIPTGASFREGLSLREKRLLEIHASQHTNFQSGHRPWNQYVPADLEYIEGYATHVESSLQAAQSLLYEIDGIEAPVGEQSFAEWVAAYPFQVPESIPTVFAESYLHLRRTAEEKGQTEWAQQRELWLSARTLPSVPSGFSDLQQDYLSYRLQRGSEGWYPSEEIKVWWEEQIQPVVDVVPWLKVSTCISDPAKVVPDYRGAVIHSEIGTLHVGDGAATVPMPKVIGPVEYPSWLSQVGKLGGGLDLIYASISEAAGGSDLGGIKSLLSRKRWAVNPVNDQLVVMLPGAPWDPIWLPVTYQEATRHPDFLRAARREYAEADMVSLLHS